MVAFIENISETVIESLAGTSAQVDSEASVIRGVKLIGFESRNNRSYPPSVLKAAVTHYENTPVNLDHPAKPTDPRSVRDRIGVIRSARFVEGKGVYGDFHFNPKHSAAEQILWDAQNNPAAVGFSHNANLHVSKAQGKTVVESIASVRSMDLVANPATTNGFFESETIDDTEGVIAEKIAADDRWHDLHKIVDAATSMMSRQLYERDSKDVAASVVVLTNIASDLLAELAAYTPTPPPQGGNMAESTDTIESLQAELKALKAEKAAIEFKAAVEGELAACKLTAEQISDPFRKVLFATESADDRAALIADREAVFATEGEQPTKPTGSKPKTTPVTEGVELTPEAMARSLRSR